MHISKRHIIQGVMIMVGLIFIIKLLFIQVLNSTYTVAAEKNIVQRVEIPPYRGVMYDRYENLLVCNTPIYDLMVTPKAIKYLDTLSFCQDFNISVTEFNKYLAKAKKYSYVKSSVLIKNIDHLSFAKIQDRLSQYRGFSIRASTVRSYPHVMLANALGYLGEISATQLEADASNYYNKADLIGISGLEKYYETILRGNRGYQYVITDVKGKEKGSFKNGMLDILATPGKDLITTIDSNLQKYGEQLLKGKIGSIVVIEPSTGEILAMVSSPSYNPNMLVGKNFGSYFATLEKDSTAPLFNRCIMAMYPPGSIFKLLQALIALQEKLILPSTTYSCNRKLVNCHDHPSPTNLQQSIQYSCNPYFYHVFKKLIHPNISKDMYEDLCVGLDRWLAYVRQFGLGTTLGVDLPNEKSGYIPDVAFYDARYGKRQWKASTIRSLDIGQGEILLTPLQMANLAVIMANKGHYYQPHLVKAIDKQPLNIEQFKKYTIAIDQAHFDVVVDAMQEAVANGPAWRAKIKGIAVCGKTGTAENPHGPDHAVFMGFAPYKNPAIAIAVYVENAGWGSRSATAIAGLMVEQYLKGKIERNEIENYVLEGNFTY